MHTAVVRETRSKGLYKCFEYAAAGCFLAGVLLGREYELAAGWLLHDAAEEIVEEHSWFFFEHPRGRLEVVDLASRHYPAYLAGLGGRWRGRPPSPVLWGWAPVRQLPKLEPADQSTQNFYGQLLYDKDAERRVERIARAAYRAARRTLGV